MTALHWERYPQVSALPCARTGLTIQSHFGLAHATIDAYGRALQDYLTFCMTHYIVPQIATREHIASYVNDLTQHPHRYGPNVIKPERKDISHDDTNRGD